MSKRRAKRTKPTRRKREPEAPHIAVLVDSATGWGRRIVEGILSYSTSHGPWRIWLRPKGQEERLRLPAGWDGDGVIARISSPAMQKHLIDRGPVVNISGIRLSETLFPRVTSDVPASVELAVQHFIDRGHRQFAYCALNERTYVKHHTRLFQERVKEHGFACHVFSPGAGFHRLDFAQRQRVLRNWLKELPKPCGLLTWATMAGVDVINACADEGIRVPDEIAVLGGDYDDLMCEACQPALSGLSVPARQTGFEAAAMLAELMKGKRLKKQEVLIPATAVIERVSTNVIAVEDEDLAAAVAYIRRNAHLPMRVNDVAFEVAVSRRKLERKFRARLGRTMLEEIARVHLERAIVLLSTTELSIPDVARSSGYRTPEYFATTFRQQMDITPLKYRAKVRGQRTDQG